MLSVESCSLPQSVYIAVLGAPSSNYSFNATSIEESATGSAQLRTEVINNGGFESDSSLWTLHCFEDCTRESFDFLSQTVWLTTTVTHNLNFGCISLPLVRVHTWLRYIVLSKRAVQ